MANPIVARSLDEIQFWSRIMKEHALFLSLGFTYEQQQLIEEAKQFIARFERIEEKLARFSVNSDIRQIQAFNSEVYQAAVDIWGYKRKVLGLTLRCEIRTNNFPLLVDHISREAAFFANRLKELNDGKLTPEPDKIIQENVFFLRIMADHAKFIGHLLDPSERKLVQQANEFSHDFDQLVFQAIDLDSMRPQSETVPILDQFLNQNRISVASLRDFKKTARDLIEACRIKSNIHPLLADHTFREAERFIEIIDLFDAHLTGQKL
ncbi:DUF2935 domain-containing protein [Niallia taxi]|uniref:DUF2935 domain-containing protein n=1 Tax=Niallia taxi TaxID=2499688 RepID=UPI0011A11CDB|nr:DUF2935 domain-containing protein [Niallia taxi]MCT2345097.1 DUF2935 domain-containing protein [Niallia taxi]MDE5052644.1 DUF2935 domain-containing protein [Niallia taxi]MED3963013.1 DUF2935 domain-containing protein [Niallia taxi]WOD65511.1 DUF2935 domain-containing protein [Niallia taxi]